MGLGKVTIDFQMPMITSTNWFLILENQLYWISKLLELAHLRLSPSSSFRSFSSWVTHVIKTVMNRIIIATTQNFRNWLPPSSRSRGSCASGSRPYMDSGDVISMKAKIHIPKPYPTILPAWVILPCQAFPEFNWDGGVMSSNRFRSDAWRAFREKSNR